ncbi:insulinase family protein [Hyphomonas neptunium ATCC 15444]|uniref:Insulinase family protein n=2 Tax=Hyphomonas TaxID=85 RepID=Q0C3W4_HYPNA|nr:MULTISPECIES: pitrilysin family protein [Hyphomonas]ABI78646.1 insulinase family protein [Hyphomonas neptunium ATCC 15444]KCZ96210.1 insulinase family protein [Hyphomonas hirschiana VP5]
MKRILVAAGLLAFAAAGALAEPATETSAPSSFMLDNGLQVVVVPDHRAPVVTHMVWYKVGAVDEAPGKSGIAHLFEHVMFKETRNIGPEEFTSIVQRSGGQLNAFTSWDYTAYFERVHKDQLGKMMELEAERMVNLIINDDPEGPFISERDVVKEERRQRLDNNPAALLQEMVLTEFWKGHPYEITVIGLMDEVNALTPQDGLDFYREYYSPENAILVVAGDVTEEGVRALAEQHYGPLQPTGEAHDQRKWQPVAPLAETKLITHSDPKVRQPVWSRYYLGTSFNRDPERALALEVGLEVLGGGLTSRLYQTLVEEQKVAINVATFAWTTLHDEGPAVIYGTPVDGVSLEDLDAAVMAEIEKILAEGFTEDEVRRARNKLAATAIYQTDSQSAMANHYGANLALGFTLEEIASYPDEVRAVTPDEALAAVRAVFGADQNYITSHLLPAEGDL